MSKIVNYRCANCGGHEIGHDGYSAFNPITQEWELGDEYDATWCSDCGENGEVEKYQPEGEELAYLQGQITGYRQEERYKANGAELVQLLQRALRGDSTRPTWIKDAQALIAKV